MRVFDHGRAHPDLSQEAEWSTYLEFGPDADTFWTVNGVSAELDVRRFRITEADITVEALAASVQNPFGSEFHMRDGRLFLATGEVIDAATLARLARLEPALAASWVAVDDLPGRVVLGSAGSFQFRIYDANTLTSLGELDLWSGVGDRRDLERWGADGLAIAAPGRICLARSEQLAPTAGQDTDGDGLPDAWELAMGFPPRQPNGDGDGASDADEFVAGTDAREAGDVFRIEVTAAGQVQVSFRSAVGRRYQLERTGTLPGTWEGVGAEILGTGERLTLEAPAAGGETFLRVSVAKTSGAGSWVGEFVAPRQRLRPRQLIGPISNAHSRNPSRIQNDGP